ncbi:S-locus glycoprotein domain [Sesbania bispinosa]|nr:S-locus glycoprotein domain [Sesbania bispinosa]
MSLPLFLPCILLALLSSLNAQNSSSAINLNSTITAGSNSTWKSSSGDFEFGFYPLSNALFLVGIWFAKIPDTNRTLVWYRSPPVEPNSLIQLTSGGHLTLTHPNGTIAQTIDDGGDTATSAYMQDNGNFVMKDSNLRTVWESFNSPVNTLLPGQTLQTTQILYSKGRGASNYSTGDFMLQMQGDGNLVLKAHQWSDPAYWYTSTLTPGLSLVFNDTSASLFLANGTANIYTLTNSTPTPVKDYYHRATIDENGNFQQYAYHKRNGTKWQRVWRAIDDPCRVDAVCGIYGLCTSPDNESVNCDCIPGYVPLDQQDVSKGCHSSAVINYCAGSSMTKLNFKLQVFDDTDFQFYPDFARIVGVDLEGCKKSVMDDCNIIAATFNATTSTCAKKRVSLLNARKSSSSMGQKAILKVPISDDSSTSKVSNKKSFNDEVGSEDSDLVLLNWILRCMMSRILEQEMRHDSEVLDDFKRFEQMALVGLWCVHPNPALRPSMKQVMQMLEGTVEVGVPPLLYDQMMADQSL